jgi:hypothetical protein
MATPLFRHAASILFITQPGNKPMAGIMRAAALIGAAIWPPAAMTTTAAETLPSLATLQREVAEQLRDPPTVRFRNIHIAHGDATLRRFAAPAFAARLRIKFKAFEFCAPIA